VFCCAGAATPNLCPKDRSRLATVNTRGWKNPYLLRSRSFDPDCGSISVCMFKEGGGGNGRLVMSGII
jgi:hypothetical protein